MRERTNDVVMKRLFRAFSARIASPLDTQGVALGFYI